MGVPQFYRWLAEKYPLCIVPLAHETATRAAAGADAHDCDCLYLDVNGIIHASCIVDPVTGACDTAVAIARVCDAVVALFALVRPRLLLFVAIDGVAPRAKMNHQRGRRFRKAREKAERYATETLLREAFESAGRTDLPERIFETWDSNMITPGTPFMHDLAQALHAFLQSRVLTDAAWQGVQVIVSDASVPGEGEHKIMSHIRSQRAQHGYPCDVKHWIYGQDADLIMLGLATHELFVSILRDPPPSHSRVATESSYELVRIEIGGGRVSMGTNVSWYWVVFD